MKMLAISLLIGFILLSIMPIFAAPIESDNVITFQELGLQSQITTINGEYKETVFEFDLPQNAGELNDKVVLEILFSPQSGVCGLLSDWEGLLGAVFVNDYRLDTPSSNDKYPSKFIFDSKILYTSENILTIKWYKCSVKNIEITILDSSYFKLYKPDFEYLLTYNKKPLDYASVLKCDDTNKLNIQVKLENKSNVNTYLNFGLQNNNMPLKGALPKDLKLYGEYDSYYSNIDFNLEFKCEHNGIYNLGEFFVYTTYPDGLPYTSKYSIDNKEIKLLEKKAVEEPIIFDEDNDTSNQSEDLPLATNSSILTMLPLLVVLIAFLLAIYFGTKKKK